jgi:glycosyltransferase involved in cell wall biosynthesis
MRISIITLSFNQGAYLEQAIRSVLDQPHDDLEYIVVDPGSTDDSRKTIEKYRSRISKIIFEPDLGPADGLNKGFNCASGDIYGYLNADDYFEPGAFHHVTRVFKSSSDVDVLCGAIRIVDKKGNARLRKVIADRFDLNKVIAGVSSIGQQGTFFRRGAFELSGPFNIENRTSWDGELLVDFALAGCRFAVIHRVLGNFRIHDESISGSGRSNQQYLQDQQRILARLAAANIRVRPVRGAALRFWRKANAVRHIRSLAVR